MKKLLLLFAFLCVTVVKAQPFAQGPSNFGLSDGTKFLAFGDLDHDGDMDAFSMNSSNHNIYIENTGSPTTASFAVGPYDFGLEPTTGDIAFVDMDHDGDLDAWSVNGGLGAPGTSFWLNTGNYAAPSFTNGQPNYGISGSFYGIAFVDIDNDGDMDAFGIDSSNGTMFWRNIGSVTTPSFSGEANLGLIANGTDIDFADIDSDGDMDAFTISSSGVTYWVNTGSNVSPAFTQGQSNFGLTATGINLSLVDIDGDGDKDAFSINSTGGATYWENGTLVSGIHEAGSISGGKCWPNPFTAAVTISTGKNLNNARLVIYDVCGKEAKVIENISGASVTIDRANLPHGVYSYKLSQDQALLAAGRLIAE